MTAGTAKVQDLKARPWLKELEGTSYKFLRRGGSRGFSLWLYSRDAFQSQENSFGILEVRITLEMVLSKMQLAPSFLNKPKRNHR